MKDMKIKISKYVWSTHLSGIPSPKTRCAAHLFCASGLLLGYRHNSKQTRNKNDTPPGGEADN